MPYINQMMENAAVPIQIGVIGYLTKDEIVSLDGKVTNSIGGIAYNLAALSAVGGNFTIYPVCNIGNDIDEMVRDLINQSPGLNTKFIRKIDKPNRIHRLKYMPDGSRQEWNSALVRPISMSRIPNNFDALHINFISGNDVSLKQLSEFKSEFKGIIYCDFHSLSLGYKKDNTRYLRRHRNWEKYISYVDGIQMNIDELATLFTLPPAPSNKIILNACSHLLSLGPAIALITMGNGGAIISSPKYDIGHYIPPVPIKAEVDPTGCGDTMAAAFLYNFIRTGDIIHSIENANLYAAAKATFSGLKGFKNINNIIAGFDSRPLAERII